MTGVGIDRARDAKASLAVLLADRPEVTGIGLARDGEGWAIRVVLARAVAVPPEHEGVRVLPEIVGPLRPRS